MDGRTDNVLRVAASRGHQRARLLWRLPQRCWKNIPRVVVALSIVLNDGFTKESAIALLLMLMELFANHEPTLELTFGNQYSPNNIPHSGVEIQINFLNYC